jgi:eukaryotic-like serine/threonine-protein kinase
LADDNPKVPDYRESVALALHNLGELAHALGREAEARDDYNQAIALRERLVAENPKRTLYRGNLADALRRRGLARRALADPAGAAADVRRALGLYEGLPSRSADEWFETACCHSALASLAGRDGAGVSAAEGTAEADQAMALIRKAVDMGYRDAEAFRTDWAFDPIREREDFKKLLAELEKTSPAKPK